MKIELLCGGGYLVLRGVYFPITVEAVDFGRRYIVAGSELKNYVSPDRHEYLLGAYTFLDTEVREV